MHYTDIWPAYDKTSLFFMSKIIQKIKKIIIESFNSKAINADEFLWFHNLFKILITKPWYEIKRSITPLFA